MYIFNFEYIFFTSCINSFSSDTGQYIKKIKEKNKIDSSHIFIIYNDYSCSSCIESTFMFFSHSIYTRDTFPILTCVYIGKSQKKFEVLKKKFSHPKINMTWDTVDFHKVSKYMEPSELIYYNSNNHKAVRFNMANIENVKPLILDIFEEK